VAAFIDNVIVGTEMEEGYDKIVAEVIRRLEKNNLYMKPEKCKWKVREVGFLEVMIRPEEMKMEKEKVKGILEWPTPICVKDIQKFLGLANYYHQFIQGFATIARSLYEKDGLWRPVVFLSKSLNETKRNYEIHDKEMLVIIRGLEN